MASRKDCIDDIAKRSGRPRRAVEADLADMDERASGYEQDGYDRAEAYRRARDEKLDEIAEEAARSQRERVENVRKDTARLRFYRGARAAIDNLPIGESWKNRLKGQAARYAFEAKLVGISLPIFGNRKSVDAQFIALRRRWVGGFVKDLHDAGLVKVFATGEKTGLVKDWVGELFELNKQPSAAWQRAKDIGDTRTMDELGWRGEGPGNPGITKNAQAQKIAEIIHKWQKVSINALNDEGASVRSYSGYVTRQSHDADKIAKGGPEAWVSRIANDPKFDAARSFGTRDPQRVRDSLFDMWSPMAQGDHFDYGKPVDEPLYPNTARKASATRELHWKDGAGWHAYNAEYGVNNPTMTVVRAIETAARRTALMREFGTRPREAYESDKAVMLAELQAELKGRATKLNALEQAANSAGADGIAKAAIDKQMEALRTEIAQRSADFENFKSWQVKLDNRFAQIDGTSLKPVTRGKAAAVANIMSVQRMSKLGNLFMTHFSSLVTKISHANYWGIPLAERWGSVFGDFTRGGEGTAKREALNLTLVAFENEIGHLLNRYDVADAPAGALAKWEDHFFTLTGVNAVIDNQRAGFERMGAHWLGRQRGRDWADVDFANRRIMQGYGIGEAEWRALKGADWSTLDDGRTYLFADDAMKLTDDQVKAYLKETQAKELGRAEPNESDIRKGRDELATKLAAMYADQGAYALPMPSARVRAMLFGKDFEPGSSWNIAKKLFWQFKLWPIDMITRAWEREIYGRIGDNRMGRVTAMVEITVASIVFGVGGEAIRDLIKGEDPIAKLREHPIASVLAGIQRSGMGSIVGDYLLGQFDRHGLSAAANLLGPTFGQIDDVAELIHAGGRTKEGMFSKPAMRERAATAIKMVKSNTPGMNLWLTHHVTDALIWHRLQEWINPGYLQRAEQRQRSLQGTQHIVSPAATDRWITGGPAPALHLPGTQK